MKITDPLLAYEVCYFDVNVSDLGKKKKVLLWKRSMDRGRRSTSVVKRHVFQKGGIDLQSRSQKNEAWNGRSQIRNMDMSRSGSLGKTLASRALSLWTLGKSYLLYI